MKRPMPLGLDFAGHGAAASTGGWLLLAVGAACLLAAAFDWQDSSDEAGRWRDEAARWERNAKRVGHVRTVGGTGELQPQVAAASQAVARLAIPWSALFGCLEEQADEDVSLLAILPNPDKGEVRLNGEARNFPALRRYLQRLAESGTLAEPRLQSHDVRESDAQRPIVFSVVAAWRGKP